jgi:uncharacterized protein with FMN-binding domain
MWILGTVCALVLLFSYRTSTMGPANAETSQRSVADSGTTAADGGGDPGGSGSSASASAGASAGASSGGSSNSGTKTYQGKTVQTRWGPVQVQVKVSGNKIVDATALKHPSENRKDIEINNYALPILRQATLDAQSANIDTVSGATITSQGYISSLQSALDSAHFQG